MSRLSDDLLEHLRAPRNVGAPAGGHDLQCEARHPACRDHLVLYLALGEGRVVRAGFKAAGCPAALGTASAVTDLLPGLAVDGDLVTSLRARFVERYGEPAALHRHALELATNALRQATA